MLLRRNVLTCLAAVTVCLAAIALGKAVRQELLNEDADVVGRTNLNYAKGANRTECQINCWDMESETEYSVLLCECHDDGAVTDCFEIGSLTTNKKGKGHLHASVEGDVSDRHVVIGIVGNDGAVTPCGYDKRLGLEPALFITPIHIPDFPVWDLYAPKVVEVEFTGDYYEGDGYYIIFNPDTPILVTFDRAIDLSTVTENTFIVGGGHVNGTLSTTNNDLTVVFEPDDQWVGDDWIDVTLVGTPDPDHGSEVMKGTRGLAIDGDADNSPGGDFTFLIVTWPN